MNVISLVARREITTRVRERGFLISTSIMLIVVVAVILVSHALSGRTKTFDVGVAGPNATALAAGLHAAPHESKVRVHVRTYSDGDAARSAVRSGDVDAAIGLGSDIVVKSDVDSRLRPILQSAYASVRSAAQLRAAGLDPAKVGRALDVDQLGLRKLQSTGGDHDAKRAIAYIGVIILYGQLIGYGMAVAMGVVEEKASRVVELLLSTVRPWQLLTGKILGIGVVGLGQLLLTAVVGLVTGSATGAVSLGAGTIGTVLDVVAWFVLGFAFYACAFATAAALVSRQEELQNAVSPLTLGLVVSFFIGLSVINNPDAGYAKVVSVIPPISAMTMPTRVATGQVAGWEIGLAVLLMLVAVAGLVRLAGRIYGGAVLRSGPRLSWREALHTAPR